MWSTSGSTGLWHSLLTLSFRHPGRNDRLPSDDLADMQHGITIRQPGELAGIRHGIIACPETMLAKFSME
jgi:hypothetical protein